MMKSEFESRIGAKVSQEIYAEIEDVYVWHPAIPEVGGKEKIAEIWKMGGIGLIRSMAESAKICREYTMQLEDKMRHIAELQQQIAFAEAEVKEIKSHLDYYKF